MSASLKSQGFVDGSQVRLAITDSKGGPTIWDFALFPPR